MKVKYDVSKLLEKYNYLDEVYFERESDLDRHYNKHVVSDEDGPFKMEYMSKDDYNNLADTLSSAPASRINDRSARIIGYVTERGRFVKYDRDTNLVVAYVDDDVNGHTAISLYKQPISKFYRKLNSDNPDFKFKSHIK